MRAAVTRRLLRTCCISCVFSATTAMAIDLDALWQFDDPARSEERFRAALTQASGDDALILQTQIARTYGLRREFGRARAILAEIAPRIEAAGPQAQARYWLELGRTEVSAVHDDKQRTPAAVEHARSAYRRAIEIARAASLDALQIDAIHMMAFVDRDPADGLRWAREALAVALASDQPAARRWEAALRNNVGYALHQLGRHEESLAEFRLALAAREEKGSAADVRIARWMVALALRHLGRFEEARDIQLRLEREWDEAGEPDPYVYEELEQIYRALDDKTRAGHYAAKLKASRSR
jgi:tetratricopeptide (TPR) repeat protein